MHAQPILAWLGLALVLAACASPSPRASEGEGQARPDSPPRAKQLVVAVEGEPGNLLVDMGQTAGVNVSQVIRLTVHQHLAGYDTAGNALPVLAAQLPSTADGSWLVRPDGTMQTTYRIRPGITWHDGAPLTARDFVFAWQVTSDPTMPIMERTTSQLITAAEASDELTLTLEWSSTYPFASAIADEDLGPFPAHLLEASYNSDKERFIQLPLWTRELVGVGPFRMESWEPGSHMTLRAYDGFYGGRAKLDTLIFRFHTSGDTIVAAMLAGSADGALKRALSFNQAMTVKESWEQEGRTPLVVVQPTHYRHIVAQLREPRLPEIQDARFRRALLVGIDRPSLVDAMLASQAPVARTFIAPDDVKWDWVKDVASPYEYDPRRASELLNQAGWVRAADGTLRTDRDDRNEVPLTTNASDKNVRELAIIANYWKALGLTVDQTVLSPVEGRDVRVLANIPGLITWSVPASYRNTLKRTYGPGCPTEQTRWVGTNMGCYRNGDLDRVIDGLSVAIDPTAQRALYRERIRIESEELPLLPLYFDVQVHIFREGVRGIKGETNPVTSVSWNAAEWDVD